MEYVCLGFDLMADRQLIGFFLRLAKDNRTSIETAAGIDVNQRVDHTSSILIAAGNSQMLETNNV